MAWNLQFIEKLKTGEAMSKDVNLSSLIERWLEQGSKRNIQTLARISGVPYPTIRRILQQESTASLETAIALLNVVATIPETLSYFSDIECANRFFKRFAEYSSPKPEQDLPTHIVDRESFWILMLGLTIGATQSRVKDLLGSYGIATLNRLVEKGIMFEKAPDLFMTKTESAFVHYDNDHLANLVGGFINDMPSEIQPLQRFLVCNVNDEGFAAMRSILKKAFEECQGISRTREGDHVVAFSFTGKHILSKE
jgi:hypothetical protein